MEFDKGDYAISYVPYADDLNNLDDNVDITVRYMIREKELQRAFTCVMED
jgi:hypothetical protein